jgi:hypothetical protein
VENWLGCGCVLALTTWPPTRPPMYGALSACGAYVGTCTRTRCRAHRSSVNMYELLCKRGEHTRVYTIGSIHTIHLFLSHTLHTRYTGRILLRIPRAQLSPEKVIIARRHPGEMVRVCLSYVLHGRRPSLAGWSQAKRDGEHVQGRLPQASAVPPCLAA